MKTIVAILLAWSVAGGQIIDVPEPMICDDSAVWTADPRIVTKADAEEIVGLLRACAAVIAPPHPELDKMLAKWHKRLEELE